MPRGAKVGNGNALRHGGRATKSDQIVRRTTVEQRRMLRQLNQKRSDLDSVGKALLLNWARASAALHEMDGYAEREGWLKGDGEPRGFAKLYVSMLNSERLALRTLAEHLRSADPADDALAALIAEGRKWR